MISIFLNRIFRAIKIDIELYEEVEKDKSATLKSLTDIEPLSNFIQLVG